MHSVSERDRTSRRTSLARWLVPALLVLLWIGVAGWGGPFFGQLSEVQSQSQQDFLPESAESTQVLEIRAELQDETDPPAIVVATNDGGLSPEDLAAIEELLEEVGGLEGVGTVSPLIPAEDAGADPDTVAGAQAFAAVTGESEVVEEIRAILDSAPDGITVEVTGPAAFAADLSEAFGGIDSILLLVAVAAVFLILLIVYRSPVLPLLVLTSSVAALALSVVAVYAMASAGWIDLNGQAQGILFILVIGAATDYALLLIARYRDALREEPDPLRALWRAWRAVIRPVLASAGTVVAGLLCLLLSDLTSNQALGPVASVGIVCAVLATLTFLPALLALTRRVAFFPFIPRAAPADSSSAHNSDAGGPGHKRVATRAGFWGWLAALTDRHPRRLWVGTAVFLILTAALAPTFRAAGVPESEFLLGEPESVTGQETLAELFPGGTGNPAIIIGDVEFLEELVEEIEATEGVASVALGTEPGEDGVPSADGPPTEGEGDAPDEAGGPPADAEEQEPATTEVEGREVAEIQATLSDPADSDAAIATVERLRETLPEIDANVLIGGESATTLDTRDTARSDLWTIIPLVLAVIAVILMGVLRAVIAPLLLVAATTVSFLSALGISAVFFNHVFGFSGADPVVPLFAFVFLVALGIDYSIFLATRIREEAEVIGTRRGALEGLRVTGSVITSAGIVLAATFAALAVIPLLFLVQLAFIVAVGVLIDTLIVRSLLVPGLFYDIGSRIWWPSRLAKGAHRAQ
ncbi:MMPL family transporter [Bogoriella caseilytica]|uniref:RND superfamily putative drug exporter n=1 Tax=Bogoriella caseilytica TaxID=56055 RepID=A0A3N2BCP3_9MICO|nr:efflux RND transporter permease subunit [Bogoriella caseilytica]ROR73033.1 RND superfamily putative drug exporter [Bogoriella caseilytica]